MVEVEVPDACDWCGKSVPEDGTFDEEGFESRWGVIQFHQYPAEEPVAMAALCPHCMQEVWSLFARRGKFSLDRRTGNGAG